MKFGVEKGAAYESRALFIDHPLNLCVFAVFAAEIFFAFFFALFVPFRS